MILAEAACENARGGGVVVPRFHAGCIPETGEPFEETKETLTELPVDTRAVSVSQGPPAALRVVVPRVWMMPGSMANAFTLVVTRELAFSRKFVQGAPDEELEAICAHELGHLSEGKRSLSIRILGTCMSLPIIFLIPAMNRFGPMGMVGIYVPILALALLKRRWERAMENRADRIAAGGVEDPRIYAKALERIYRINLVPASDPTIVAV